MTPLTTGNLSLSRKLNNINELLAEWNPINVPDAIAQSEYLSYAREIERECHTPCDVNDYLIRLLDELLGLSIEDLDTQGQASIKRLSERIFEIIR